MKDTNNLLQDLANEVELIEVPNVKNHAKARYLTEQKSKKSFLFVRPLSSIFAGAIIMVLLFIGISQSLPITPPSITLSAQEKESILLQSISGVTLLLNEDEETNISYIPLSTSEDDESDLIHDFILTLEQLLSAESLTSLSTSRFSNLEGYTYKESIAFTTLFNQQFSYEFHYALQSTNETNDNFTLTGVLIIEDKTFEVSGQKNSINEAFSYNFEIKENESNTIQVVFGEVDGEMEYHFQMTKGNMSKQLRFKKVKDSLTPKFEIKLTEGDKEEEYYIEKDNLGQKISMQAKNNSHRIEVQMRNQNNDTIYEYYFPESGKTIEKNPRHPHEDGHPGRRPNRNTNYVI